MNYAREWVFSGGRPMGPFMKDFQRLYTEKEQAHVLKLVRLQEFANLFMNTFFKKAWKKGPENKIIS